MIGYSGAAEYVCTNPAAHPDAVSPHSRREARAAEDEREGKKAAKARDIACAAIVAGPLPHVRVLLQQITAALLGYGGGHADSMRMAASWLAEAGAASKGTDHYRLPDKMMTDRDHGGLQRYAWAYALAGDEPRVPSMEHLGHGARRPLRAARLLCRVRADSVGAGPAGRGEGLHRGDRDTRLPGLRVHRQQNGARSATTATKSARYARAPGTAPGTSRSTDPHGADAPSSRSGDGASVVTYSQGMVSAGGWVTRLLPGLASRRAFSDRVRPPSI
jgi:hypothetical protein